ncbi:MAG: hypothetical protein CVU89_07685 [Firmicutes bacterium HGW-Firmicutes-14]|nr:MAG: hypothetical protein CVU89_07685 [Firmicutes bacterium HGW-Firmicutes-14]
MIVNTLGMGDDAAARKNSALPFKDADKVNEDAAGYIAIAVENHIINGFPDGTFQPNKPVTRAQMAVMLGLSTDELGIPGELKNKIAGIVLEVTTEPVTVADDVYGQGTITLDFGDEDKDGVKYPVAEDALI